MASDSAQNYATELQSLLIKTADLDASRSLWQHMLGYAPIWQGRCGSALGAIFDVSNIRVEIYQFDRDVAAGAEKAEALEGVSESIYGLCFTALDGLHNESAEAVLFHSDADASVLSCRQIELDSDRSRQISILIRDSDLFAASTDGASALAPNRAFASTFTSTKEQVTKIDHVVLQTHDTDAVKKIYGDALGIRLALEQDVPKWGGTMLFYRSAHMSIEIISNTKTDAARDQLWGVAFTCSDIDAVHARLASHGGAVGLSVSDIRDGRKPGTRVSTIKGISIPTLLIGDSAV